MYCWYLTCLVVMIMVKVTAPNSEIVWKINNWPVVEQIDKASTSAEKPTWAFMNSKAGMKPPCSSKEKPVNSTCRVNQAISLINKYILELYLFTSDFLVKLNYNPLNIILYNFIVFKKLFYLFLYSNSVIKIKFHSNSPNDIWRQLAQTENTFTPTIICIEDILCLLNNPDYIQK